MRVLLIDCEGIDVRRGSRRAAHADWADVDDGTLRSAAVIVLGPGLVAEGDAVAVARRLDVAGGMVLLVSPVQRVGREERWTSTRVGRFVRPEDVACAVRELLRRRPVPWPSPREWMGEGFGRIERNDRMRAVIRAARSLEEVAVPVWWRSADLNDVRLREMVRERQLALPRAALARLRRGIACAQLAAGSSQQSFVNRGLYSSQPALSRALRRSDGGSPGR